MGTKSFPRRDEPRISAPGFADALLAKVRQRVLAALLGNPRRTLYANDVIALARPGYDAVQRSFGGSTSCATTL